MTSKTLLIPALGLMAIVTLPVSAQDAAEGAETAETQQQVKEIEQAIEELKNNPPPTPPSDRLGPPVPPPISIAPAPPALYIPPPAPPSAPLPPRDYSSKPRLVSFQALDAKPTDYPIEAWNADEEGSVRFELAVNKEGKPTGCTILDSSGSASLDAKTCEIGMTRAEFEPALNEDGEPVAGEHRDYQTWTKRQPQFGANTVVDVSFTVTEDGDVLNCEVNEMSGEISDRMRKNFEREPCPGMKRPPGAVYRDENGIPVAKNVRLRVLVDVEDPPAPQ